MLIALTSRDLDTDATRAVSLGATNEGRHEENGFEWVDMRDSEGNRFNFQRAAAELGSGQEVPTRTLQALIT